MIEFTHENLMYCFLQHYYAYLDKRGSSERISSSHAKMLFEGFITKLSKDKRFIENASATSTQRIQNILGYMASTQVELNTTDSEFYDALVGNLTNEQECALAIFLIQYIMIVCSTNGSEEQFLDMLIQIAGGNHPNFLAKHAYTNYYSH
jgi:hypothetical protein